MIDDNFQVFRNYQLSSVIYHLNNMISSLNNYQKIFFIGIAGAGMSALAQYLAVLERLSAALTVFYSGTAQ